MKLFRQDNTRGYTQEQLNALNKEWENIVEESSLKEGTDEYEEQAKIFCDEVARR